MTLLTRLIVFGSLIFLFVFIIDRGYYRTPTYSLEETEDVKRDIIDFYIRAQRIQQQFEELHHKPLRRGYERSA